METYWLNGEKKPKLETKEEIDFLDEPLEEEVFLEGVVAPTQQEELQNGMNGSVLNDARHDREDEASLPLLSITKPIERA